MCSLVLSVRGVCKTLFPGFEERNSRTSNCYVLIVSF